MKQKDGSETTKLLREMTDMMKDNQELQKVNETEEMLKMDWALVAMVIDRFLLISFALTTVGIYTWMFATYPYANQKGLIDTQTI